MRMALARALAASLSGVLHCRSIAFGSLRGSDALADEIDDGLRGGAGKKNLGDAGLLEGGDVGFGDDSADRGR